MSIRTSFADSIIPSLCFALCCAFAHVAGATVSTAAFGAAGDGIADDTASLQLALTHCSDNNLECRIPAGASHYITGPLFMWGGASLSAEAGGELVFDAGPTPYLLNLGIAAMVNPSAPTANLRDPFTGEISGVTFRVAGGTALGRIIYFWRSRDAKIADNRFEVGALPYSATSSGNNSAWVNVASNTIRENVTISNNVMHATATAQGFEGIGLAEFDGALIEHNTVIGVGDDPIGIHLCDNVKILHNTLESVDGRLFVSNSHDVEIAYNKHTRIASPLDDDFYQGIGLVYIGFERFTIAPTNLTKYRAPTGIHVHHNELRYNDGAIDIGAGIYLYGTRNTVVEQNFIINESDANGAAGIYLLPARLIGWNDPSLVDRGVTLTVGSTVYDMAQVHETTVDLNVSTGPYPLAIKVSDYCMYFPGPVAFTNNLGPVGGTTGVGAPGYSLGCAGFTKTGNKSVSPVSP